MYILKKKQKRRADKVFLKTRSPGSYIDANAGIHLIFLSVLIFLFLE